jgi:hypothetical protein
MGMQEGIIPWLSTVFHGKRTKQRVKCFDSGQSPGGASCKHHRSAAVSQTSRSAPPAHWCASETSPAASSRLLRLVCDTAALRFWRRPAVLFRCAPCADERTAYCPSGAGSASASSSGVALGSFSSADSALSVSFIAPANKPVKSPPLMSVLRKNSHVCGQPAVP